MTDDQDILADPVAHAAIHVARTMTAALVADTYPAGLLPARLGFTLLTRQPLHTLADLGEQLISLYDNDTLPRPELLPMAVLDAIAEYWATVGALSAATLAGVS